MKDTDYNLNDDVTFTLNERGIELLANCPKFREFIYTWCKQVGNRTFKCQMWIFMANAGHYFDGGGNPPTSMNVKLSYHDV